MSALRDHWDAMLADGKFQPGREFYYVNHYGEAESREHVERSAAIMREYLVGKGLNVTEVHTRRDSTMSFASITILESI